MSNCTCGRTTRPPLCDGSHWLSEEEYQERTEKLKKLFKKETKMKISWVDQVANSIPEHCVDISHDLRKVMNDDTMNETDRHACALVAAICSGNGDLAYEIGMSDELIGKPEREAAKTAAALVTRDAMYSIFDDVGIKEFSNQLYDVHGGVDELSFKKYVLSAIITLRANNLVYVLSVINSVGDHAKQIAKIASVVGSIGKVAI